MISATSISSTFTRFVNNLPDFSLDISRFMRRNSIQNEALTNAYMQFATTYDQWVEKHFDEDFLVNAGAGIIDDFTKGHIGRRDAAAALANAWVTQMPVSGSVTRKRHVLDVTKAAESLLGWLEAEIQGQPLVVAAPVDIAVEDAHDTAVEAGPTLDVHIRETDDLSAIIVADGILDRQSYHKFLMQTRQLYRQGIRSLTLDLANVTKVDLSGIYALHATAKIYRGEFYPRYEYGYAGLRHMVEENLQAGPHGQIQLTAINERALGTLEQSGIAELFSL